jgi:hypothetical protein
MVYLDKNPFKHSASVVEKRFQDDLLLKVKDETQFYCEGNRYLQSLSSHFEYGSHPWCFQYPEIKQTGDLTSLNNLFADSHLSQLTHLNTLRDALYSPQFHQFLRAETSCGPFSGQKQDMAINSYTQGSHRLNHGSMTMSSAYGVFTISFIYLYLTINPGKRTKVANYIPGVEEVVVGA